MEIKSTKKYDKFLTMRGNRQIYAGHVKTLVQLARDNPRIFKNSPIIVNEAMYVIDGQHRLEAAKILGVPIYYIVSEGTSIRDIMDINTKQRRWNLEDYARSYAEQGLKAYQAFVKLMEDYDQIPISVLYPAISNVSTRDVKSNSNFKNGQLTIPDEDLPKIHMRLDRLAEISQYTSLVRSDRACAKAFFKVANWPDYDHARMLNKFKNFHHIFEGRSTIEEYLREFEEIYNFKNQDNNRLRLW